MASRDTDIDLEFFERMVKTVGVGVGIYGADGEYIYINDAYAELFAASSEELTGAPIWETAPEVDQERFQSYWQSFDAGETRVAETVHEYQDVSVPVETVTTRQIIDEVPYHFGTIKDISERKRRERQLERQNERLDSFASVVAHDLKNPLNIAQGYINIFKQEHEDEEIVLINNALERMETLITELLSLAKSGNTIGDTEPTPAGEVAKIAWNAVESGGATLEIVTPKIEIMSDENRLQELFENLFRNAVDHGGQSVSITVGKMEDGFYVADDGIGIPQSEREEVFQAGHTTVSDGTGFGLNIVSQIVSAHDWERQVTESTDGGARFEITNIEFIE